jgi:arginyl-tRNA synthetase
MLRVKQDLLGALAAVLEKLQPGAGAKAAFESPKVAAHGDYAVTAAMQLAKPLRRNPARWPRPCARNCWRPRPSSNG